MDKIKNVSIALGPTMYARFEDLPGNPSHILAEFIDNALQSSRDKREDLKKLEPDYKLKISIDITWDNTPKGRATKIVITDNAAGIGYDRYLVAFQPAKAPEDNTGLNEFGMGLKTAACWLGQSWSVKTKAIGETDERTITFDLGKVTDNELSELPVEHTTKDPCEHYTIITICNPTKNSPSLSRLNQIIEGVASIYRQPLRSNEIEIKICGEKLKFEDYEILTAPFSPHQSPQGEPKYWKKEINLHIGKYSAKGFVGILKTINKDHNGFVLMRRGRVIMGSETDARYFPKFTGTVGTFRYKRLFGELELEGFEVSFNKNDIKDKENLDSLMEIVKESIHTKDLDLFTQAEDYRIDETIKNVKKLVKKHNTAPKSTRLPIKIDAAPIVQNHIVRPEPFPAVNKLQIIEKYEDQYSISGIDYTLDVVFSKTGPDLFWLDISKVKDKVITCIINTGHPYFLHFGNPSEPVVAIIKSLVVAKFSAKQYGNDSTGSMMDFFNDLIKQTKV